ncbi:GGDEF domain-containing protein [Butyrivibrio sp. CB08]|uniref:GGDEF domain-containing protein n=1 Tax=Butyrivibrio sp. CB08 TaxID=2364879 RepID=UPI000EA9F521|nr:diguanylate cyclase [Butyrivibrio sp. CB08]RKM62028.1 GGDEF domain-containing protein [Butyrivibrio sp. CB08]
MKSDFYNWSKRANVYNSIFIYKVVTLVVAVVLTIAMTILFFRDRAIFKENLNGQVPVFFICTGICLILFIISIIIDFYIIRRTVSIGKRLNKLAYIDHLTGLPNRYSCDLLIESFNNPERLPKTGFFLIQISNLGAINSSEGHKNGNYLISEFATIIEDVSENYGYVGRNGGNEYIVLLDDCDSTKADMFLLELTKRIHGYNEMNVGTPLEVHYSRVLNCDEKKEKISEIISLGYKKIREMPLTLA